MTAPATIAAPELRSDAQPSPIGETILRLAGPSIHAVCVALHELDGGRALAETFPRMRLSGARSGEEDESGVEGPRGGAAVRISASHGTVRLVIEAATDAISGASLSRDLGCSLLLTRHIPALQTRHAALFDRGRVLWEEQARSAAEPGLYRVVCPHLGLSLTVPLDQATGEVAAAVWRQIHAHVEMVVGAETARMLAREDLDAP